MNRYPTWVNWTVLLIIVAACIISLPNLFGDDPAVYVALKSSQPVAESTLTEISGALDDAGIAYENVSLDGPAAIVRFADVNEQYRGKDLLADKFQDYTASLTLAPRIPAWLAWLPLKPMSLGLDLRGGVHFVFRVDIASAIDQLLRNYEDTLQSQFKDADIRAKREIKDQSLVVTVTDGDPAAAQKIIENLDKGNIGTTPRLLIERSENTSGQAVFTVNLSEGLIQERQNFAIEQNTLTLRRRVDALGVSEPVVQRQGLDKILVELPGISDPAQADRILGGTATLEYRAVDMQDSAIDAQRTGRVPLCCKVYLDPDGNPILVNNRAIVTGDHIIDATPGSDRYSRPAVNVKLDSAGGAQMLAFTRDNVGNFMAVVYIEKIPKEVTLPNGEKKIEVETSERVINNAVIQGVFSTNFQTTGLDPLEARDLALQLRAGALAAPIVKIEEATIGPSLGADNIAKGRLAVVVGFLVVVAFMALYYRFFGFVADLALFANVVMIIALLSLLPTALTLPGIAGIVLTVGMAVDANVLIFERIREELRNGNSPQASINAGYEKAFSTIADANITTLIAALVLFAYGTGPIRGFAVTLSIGILTSMFTAIVGTRVVINLVYGRRKNLRDLSIGGGIGHAPA